MSADVIEARHFAGRVYTLTGWKRLQHETAHAIAAIEKAVEKDRADDEAFRNYMHGVDGRTRRSLAASARNTRRAADDAHLDAWHALPDDDALRERMHELAPSDNIEGYLDALIRIREEVS